LPFKRNLQRYTEARGAAASWVIWANATMWPALETSGGKCDLNNLFGPVVGLLHHSRG
jgi:glutathione S-transferase